MNLEDKEQVDFPVSTYENPWDFIKKSVQLPKLLDQLGQYIQVAQPDIAINAMPGIWDSFVTRHLSEYNIPTITVVHDFHAHKGDRFAFLYRMQRRQIRDSQGIVVLSEFVLKQLKAKGLIGRKHHRKIPHFSFEFPDLEFSPLKLSNFPQPRPIRLLLIGRLSQYKGVGLFCDALKFLNLNNIDARIVGAGNSPDLINATKLTNVQLFHHWCSETELISHIDWSDVVVGPYLEATQSGIISLAFSRARPVIVTPVGGLVEQVEHLSNGLISKSVSAEALADEILNFINDTAVYSNCAMGARKYAKEVLSLSSISQQYADFANLVLQKL